jgi:hypothetical protein
MAQWYLSYDGKQIGPLDQAQASAQARPNPHGYAWREGFTAWVPIAEIDELTSVTGGGRPAPPPPLGPLKADEIDFKIFGTVDFDIQQAGGIKTALFGGEGLFLASLRGPGRIWLQSLPFSRLAGRMLQAAPQKGGKREEGSILGGLGGLLDGDNRY